MKFRDFIKSFWLEPEERRSYEKTMLGDAWVISKTLWLIFIPAILLRSFLVGCLLPFLLIAILAGRIRSATKN